MYLYRLVLQKNMSPKLPVTNLVQISLLLVVFIPRGCSLAESMIFHTYNRFRISDLAKDFSESYGELA